MGIEVRKRGPVLDGSAGRILESMGKEAEEDVAQKAYDTIHQIMGASFRNPSGYYESRVTVSNQGDSMVLSDSGVVYGPWLEGIGSRNGRSRFKGYHMFRRTTQAIEAEAAKDVDATIGRNMGRLQ